MKTRMREELKALEVAREDATARLNAIENQIYAINKLLNPEATTDVQDPQGQETRPTPEIGKV
ncbi:MAG: hypothetical protein NWE89_11780 [Candidatus Bathyarchaeota archaeon]|nr:hypothetical protein [Candidatus Bathyarchaeota archaeon]